MIFLAPGLMVAGLAIFYGIYSFKGPISKHILGMTAEKLEKYDIKKFRLFSGLLFFLYAGLMFILAFGLYWNNNVITVIVLVVAVAMVPGTYFLIHHSRLLKKKDF